MKSATFFTIFLSILFFCACRQESQIPTSTEIETTTLTPISVTCDTCRYPIVMVHGFLASGDTYAPFVQRFHSNGYKPNLLHAFDWNSLAQGANQSSALDAFINKVLAKTGADKVRLMGHSAGGGVCYTYLNDPIRAAKVDAYVHIGSAVQTGPAGPNGSVPTLNLWSAGDLIANNGNINGATNAEIANQDHYQVATSKESFAAIWDFFHHQPPTTLEITPEAIVCIAGKVLAFGENTPLINAKVEIYPVNPETGERLTTSPFETWMSDSLGFWGPTNVQGNQTYEFVTTPPNSSQRVIHYFREGFVHLNTLVYLRTIPPPTTLAGLLLVGLPNTNNQTVLNIFSGSRGILFGRDTLTAAGSVLSTAQYASATKTAITYFCYDDGDSQTELTPVGLFGTFPFLNGVDMFFPTNPTGTIPLKLNNRVLNVRNVKSSEGVVVGVFD
jgi:dienelactone hydrolase